MAIVAAPPKPREIKAPGGTGGTIAPGNKPPPQGSSVAGRIVKNARAQSRERQPHARIPRPPQQQKFQAKVPRVKAPKIGEKIQGGPKNPYNALNSPYRTQGEFNTAVGQTAKAGYQPKLDELKTEEEGETGLTSQREADNVNIYKQYSEQAKEAFEKAKATMSEIASRQNASTKAGQEALQGALSNTGVPGVSPVQNQQAFLAEASGLGNESSQVLAGEEAGLTTEMSKDLLVPGAGLDEARREEAVRNAGVLNKIASERDKIVRTIPEITEKTRQEMMKDEETRQANRLQEQIAQQKLGLEQEYHKEAVGQRREGVAEKRKERQEVVGLDQKKLQEEAGIKTKKLQVEKEKVWAAVEKTKDAQKKAAATLYAKRYDNAVTIMANYLKLNTKTEFMPGHEPLGAAKEKGLVEYNRNAEHLYRMLTEQGQLNALEAFKIMGSSGNHYIELYAKEHEAIYKRTEQQRKEGIQNPTGGPTAIRNGKEIPTYRPPGESNATNKKREAELRGARG